MDCKPLPPPPPYSIEDPLKHVTSNPPFTCVDFFPQCLDSGGFFSQPVYENFRVITNRANLWLQKNRHWYLTNCESVVVRFNTPNLDPGKMSYQREYRTRSDNKSREEIPTQFNVGIRLWVKLRENEGEREQQIGYVNLTPQLIGATKQTPWVAFETVDVVIGKFNSFVQSNPLPGRVVCVERQMMKVEAIKQTTSDFDPERTHWIETELGRSNYSFVVRVFYEIMDWNPEIIGMKDFVPDLIGSGAGFTQVEPFYAIIGKASEWLAQEKGIRFCNAQCIGNNEISGAGAIHFRMLRVSYTKPMADHKNNYERSSQLGTLTCRIFSPAQLTKGTLRPAQFETLWATKQRMEAWVKATGARVVSAETSFNQPKKDTYWTIIRLYLDGVYAEPPMGMLPPIPELRDDACTIQ